MACCLNETRMGLSPGWSRAHNSASGSRRESHVYGSEGIFFAIDNRRPISHNEILRVIAKRPLVQFWTTYPEAERPLRNWLTICRTTDFENFGQLKQAF